MVSVHATNVVHRDFESQLGQTRDYKIGIFCFFSKYTVLKYYSKDWLARNQNTVLCPSVATCLTVDYYFSELTLYKSC